MITARFRRMTSRAQQIWNELDYAQRRVFELQTGVRATAPRRRGRGGLGRANR
jgi:hypothetical protein